MFSKRLGEDEKSYMTRQEFLTRFWAAYTYEEEKEEEDVKDNEKETESYSVPAVMESVSHNVIQANRKI